jgi:hypothetical protein
MDTALRTEPLSRVIADEISAVSWGSIAAGAVAAAALTLPLLALGSGLGLASISPWSDAGASVSTFKVGAGIYLVLVAVVSSAIGGYLAARLRTQWTGLHGNEVFFRDTAHGFIAWALATLLTAGVLGAATAHIAAGAAAGAGAAAATSPQRVNPAQVYVDRLFRPNDSAPSAGASNGMVRAEALRLWSSSIGAQGDLAPADRTYLARLIAAQTGMSQAGAENRLNDVIAQAKSDADGARKAAAKLAFWLTAAFLFGAFAASLAAVEGGQLRDGTWNDRRIVPRPL